MDMNLKKLAEEDLVETALKIIWGIIGILAVIALFAKPEKLLDAPYLSFLAFAMVVTIFHKQLALLLSRGTLTIKWGDREIAITDIEANIDTQHHELESQLSDLASEINELKAVMPQSAKEAKQSVDESSVIEKIKTVFNVRGNAEGSLIYHLANSRYKWRNQHTLVKKTGLSATDIDEFVNAYPETYIRSISKSGNIIYRLSDQAKIKFSQLVKSS
jgi:predicted small secreted protein